MQFWEKMWINDLKFGWATYGIHVSATFNGPTKLWKFLLGCFKKIANVLETELNAL